MEDKKVKIVSIAIILSFILLCFSVFFLANKLSNIEKVDCLVEVKKVEDIGKNNICTVTDYKYIQDNFKLLASIAMYKSNYYSMVLKVNDKKVDINYYTLNSTNQLFKEINFSFKDHLFKYLKSSSKDNLLFIESNDGDKIDGDYLAIISNTGDVIESMGKKTIEYDYKNKNIYVTTHFISMYDCFDLNHDDEDAIYNVKRFNYLNGILSVTSEEYVTYKDVCKNRV